MVYYNIEKLEKLSTHDYDNNDNTSHEKYEILLAEIDTISKFTNFDNLSISQEGLISNVIIGLIDVIPGIFKNVYNSLKVLKSVKRSELKAYVDNHMVRVKFTLGGAYTDYAGIVIPTAPFKTSYDETMMFLNTTYSLFDIKRVPQDIVMNIQGIVTLMLNEEYSKALEVMSNLRKGAKLYLGKETITNVQKKYSNPRIEKIEFGKVFESMSNFRVIFEGLEKHFDKFNEVKPTLNKINKIDKTVNNFLKNDTIHSLKKDKKFVKTIKEFSTLIFEIAQYFDGYGNLVKCHIQTEHHFADVLKILAKKKK